MGNEAVLAMNEAITSLDEYTDERAKKESADTFASLYERYREKYLA
jgi:hypothetical protein